MIGCGLGLLASGVFLGLERAGTWVAAGSSIAVLAFVTGGFHEDGLADTADALGGAFDRERIFVILKDSRIGSFGALALVLAVLLRAAALAKLGPLALAALVIGQTFSRTAPVWLMAALPYVTPVESSRSSDLAGKNRIQAVGATLFAVLTAAGLVGLSLVPLRSVLVCGALALVFAVVCGWRFHARAGGLTGDFLGATQQVTDVVILVALAAGA